MYGSFEQVGYFGRYKLLSFVPISQKLYLNPDWHKKMHLRQEKISRWRDRFKTTSFKEEVQVLTMCLESKPSYYLPIFPIFGSKNVAVWHYRDMTSHFRLLHYEGHLEIQVSENITPVQAYNMLNMLYLKLYLFWLGYRSK